MNPVSLTYDAVVNFLNYLRVRVDTEPGDLNILGLQGIAPAAKFVGDTATIALNNNAENIYNDSLVLAYKGEDGSKWAMALLGTVDPGAAFKDQPGGEAHLTFGQHLYVRGIHMGHPALRALNEYNRVWRDVNKNSIPSPGDYVSQGAFGVNVHAGGTTQYINNWSAGCVNVWGGWEGNPWKTFMQLVDTHCKRKNSVGVTIWSGKDFTRFQDAGWGMKPTILFGILNPWVAELQQALTRKGCYSGTCDGDWQQKTEDAVRKFQTDNKLTIDGIVGEETWTSLLA